MKSVLPVAVAVWFAAAGAAVAQAPEEWVLPPSSSEEDPAPSASEPSLPGPPQAPPQSSEGWELPGFPNRSGLPSPLPSEADLPPPPLALPPEPEPERWRPPLPPPPLRSFTLSGGRALGKGRWAVGLTAGYPYVNLRYARGFLPSLDAGLSALTFYGQMTEAALDVRWEALRMGPLSLAVNGTAGGALFLRPARTENTWGARWVTGRRHVNAELGAAVSFVPTDGRGLHPFLDVRYLLAVDLEPLQTDPLGGLPPAFVLGGNTLIRLGAELPVDERFNLLGALGLDLHGRREDSAAFFNFALGVAVSF